MWRLLIVLLATVSILVALDRSIPHILSSQIATRRSNAERDEAFRRVVYRHFHELQTDARLLVSRAHRRWELLSNVKRPQELRVCLIGNSTAMFAVAPQVVEQELAGAYPDREVSIMLLMFPAIRVVDERVLVRAALAKQADVIVVMPNLKGLMPGQSGLTPNILEVFGSDDEPLSHGNPATFLGSFLERHWQMYRARSELRDLILGEIAPSWAYGGDRARETTAIQAGVAAIADAAGRGDVRRLLATYREHRMSSLIGTPVFKMRLARASPVFEAVAATAAEVRGSRVLGIAIFLPVNPIFRDPKATAGFDNVQVDESYIRDLAEHTLRIYERAGFAVSDRVDALPASSFVDLVHVNADGMRTFSREVASIIIQSLQVPAGHTKH